MKFSALADNLRALRGSESQAQFAARIGVANQASYQRYETGRVPRLGILQNIAGALGLTVGEMLSPLSADRIAAIREAVMRIKQQTRGGRVQIPIEAFHAFHDAMEELCDDAAVTAIQKAMKFEDVSRDDFLRLYDFHLTVCNRAPPEFAKFYVLIRQAMFEELRRRMK